MEENIEENIKEEKPDEEMLAMRAHFLFALSSREEDSLPR